MRGKVSVVTNSLKQEKRGGNGQSVQRWECALKNKRDPKNRTVTSAAANRQSAGHGVISEKRRVKGDRGWKDQTSPWSQGSERKKRLTYTSENASEANAR